MEYSSLFVTLMGIGTVFFGLICIIFLTMAMGAILKGKEKAPAAAAAAPAAAPAPAPKPQGMQPEIVAAITAALSEEVGISPRIRLCVHRYSAFVSNLPLKPPSVHVLPEMHISSVRVRNLHSPFSEQKSRFLYKPDFFLHP